MLTMALSPTLSEIKGDICKIFPPVVFVFKAPAEGVHLEFCNSSGVEKKLELRPCRNVKECDDVSIRLDKVPAFDRRTDRQNW